MTTLLTLLACEGLPEEILYKESGVPSVVDLGVVTPIEMERYLTTWYSDGEINSTYFGADAAAAEAAAAGLEEYVQWWAGVQSIVAESPADPGVFFTELGAGEPGTYGGSSFTFRGTGGKVCIVVDPESLYWNQAVSPVAESGEYYYQDDLTDDGDVDLVGGLTAYYNGVPGEEIGDFAVPYSDAMGEEHYIEFDECAALNQYGNYAHAGRASPEFCELDTTNREGVDFTVVLRRFSLPINDSVLRYGVGVFEVGEGGCEGYLPTGTPEFECLIPQEWNNGEAALSALDCEDEEGEWSWECMELAYCAGSKALNNYCEAHLGEEGLPCIENDLVVAG